MQKNNLQHVLIYNKFLNLGTLRKPNSLSYNNSLNISFIYIFKQCCHLELFSYFDDFFRVHYSTTVKV